MKRLLILLILLTASTLLVYYPSLSGSFLLDDYPKIVDNPDIKNIEYISKKLIYPYSDDHKSYTRNAPTRPFAFLTFALNYYIHGLNPYGYHLVNVIIHILVVFAVFLLTHMFISKSHLLFPRSFAFFVALVFALHPVQTGSVSYIYKRTELLAAFFIILSLIFFIKRFDVETIGKKLFLIVGSLVSFVLALTSKENAVILPILLILIDYFYISESNRKTFSKNLTVHLPFWVILVIYLLWKFLYLGGIGDVEAQNTMSTINYFINQPLSIINYLKLLLFPYGLCLDRANNSIMNVVDFRFIVPLLIIGGIFLVTILLFRKYRSLQKILLLPCLWFLITLSPTSSFFPTTQLMEDNRMYLPSFGIIFIIIAVYFIIVKKYTTKFFFISILCIYITILGFITYTRNNVYADPVEILKDALKQYPLHARALNNLGEKYYERKEYNKAIRAYEQTLEVESDSVSALNGIAVVYAEIKQFDKAEAVLRKALDLNPLFTKTQNNFGSLYVSQHRYEEATVFFKEAISLEPHFIDAHLNLGITYFLQNNREQALKQFHYVLILDNKNQTAQKFIQKIKQIP